MDTVISSISPTQLQSRLGRADAPFVVDVRRKQAFDADPRMIAGATWRDPFAMDDWLKFLPRHRDIVVYCVHGHEISKNSCESVVAAGMRARFLDGGFEAWTASGGTTLLKQTTFAIPSPIPSPVNAPSRWVTRTRPKIDRIACPWLIRRFIDPTAEFLYVPAADVIATADAQNAIAYDVPNVRFTHRGEACSFDALIADFELNDPVLHDLAQIVRGADTGQLALSAQSPGLLAVSLALSALYEDDHEMLRHGMVVYDALYAWLKTARNETHNADLFKKNK
jgi:rhodanese-related sulfurtransferase